MSCPVRDELKLHFLCHFDTVNPNGVSSEIRVQMLWKVSMCSAGFIDLFFKAKSDKGQVKVIKKQ